MGHTQQGCDDEVDLWRRLLQDEDFSPDNDDEEEQVQDGDCNLNKTVAVITSILLLSQPLTYRYYFTPSLFAVRLDFQIQAPISSLSKTSSDMIGATMEGDCRAAARPSMLVCISFVSISPSFLALTLATAASYPSQPVSPLQSNNNLSLGGLVSPVNFVLCKKTLNVGRTNRWTMIRWE